MSVRLIDCDLPPDANLTELRQHARKLAETDQELPNLEIVDASIPGRPLVIGCNDVFLATAWWTAQKAKYGIHHTTHKRFVYLIQDYEPLLHPASTQQALAEETYSLDHVSVINTSLLQEFLRTRSIGRYSSDEFARQALVFEPAVDTSRFFPETRKPKPAGKRRLLFYARPTAGLRNLFELGIAALQKLIAESAIDPSDWEFLGMGEKFAPVDLGKGAQLASVPWLDFDAYARQMRQVDVLLSLMLSPHPSYPPLEMAACGGMVVTTTYGNKTAERLAALSPNIIGVAATIEAIADGLVRAVEKAALLRDNRSAGIRLPTTWTESLSHIMPRLHEEILKLLGAPDLPRSARIDLREQTSSGLFPGYRHWPTEPYEIFRFATLMERSSSYRRYEAGLFSFITTVWNTDPDFLVELAESVLGQDGGTNFEWIILNNGTEREDTSRLLEKIAKHPNVRLHKVLQNIGIVRGLRYCLERANNQYIIPLDSDDLLTPDCVRVMASALAAANYPALAYSDEDKVLGNQFRDAYCKPDWDPVLFVHSCYIAHLCAIDRTRAIELGAYTSLDAEGSHDWDTFMRFWQAGHKPLHIPEVVYSWRMHPQSTSGNITSKGYIHSSQLSVLNKFISGSQKPQPYKVDLSPLFHGTPDWRILRTSMEPLPISTIEFGVETIDASLKQPAFAGQRIVRIKPEISALLAAAKACAAEERFVHILSAAVRIDDPSWATEAITLMELFPETVIVGGRIIEKEIVTRADDYLGFGEGCGSPNVGRSLDDPGYFAQMWKPHSANAVPVEHCVVRADFLIEALSPLIGTGVGFSYLGAWLGAAARERERRVVYSPFLSAVAIAQLEQVSAVEKAAFCIAYGRLMPDDRVMSPRLGLTARTAYQAVSRNFRSEQEDAVRLVQHADNHTAAEIASRIIAKSRSFAGDAQSKMVMTPSAKPVSLSLVTTVWNTSPIYIAALADSIFNQDCKTEVEWIVLDNGSTRPDTIELLSRLGENRAVRLLRVDQNIGIVRGLRCCLEKATKDYIVPIDSDDILAIHALRHLIGSLSENPQPSFVFSDEDVFDHGHLISAFQRGEFDPVLNTCDSYIWHLCAFRRTRGLELGVYTDGGAEYCHDWDTICRFSNAGERIHHIPHVLYHWRTHAQSSSHSGSVNVGSMNSVKWVMERTIAQQKNPDLYEVQSLCH